MLNPGDRVIVGVSGGADSVCLLFMLNGFRRKIPFEMAVVHVHHGIRGDAGEDAEYVKSLCDKLCLPFYLEMADVRGLARRERISEEEAGRKARYEAFEKYAAEWVSDAPKGTRDSGMKLALAHHMGDRAETLLFHLFRGTGSRGLASIQPVREHIAGEVRMEVIRPLLCLERSEIEEYLRAAGIAYCQDSTNREDRYARNRIRHRILPCAEQEICRGTVRHINRAAEQLSEMEEYLAAQTRQAAGICTEGLKIRVDALLEQPPLIQKRVLMEMLLKLSSRHRDMGAVHVEELLELCRGGTGRAISLPQGIRAEKAYDHVILERRPESGIETKEPLPEQILPQRMQEGEVFETFFGTDCFHFLILKKNKFFQISENQYTKWFDYGKIKGTLSVRTRKTGDYLMIRDRAGGCVRKRVKDYMITEKVPRQERDRLALLAEGEHVLWIPGYRISEAFKVDERTEYILQAELVKNGG